MWYSTVEVWSSTTSLLRDTGGRAMYCDSASWVQEEPVRMRTE